MPKIAINFQNTIMYKLVCSDLNITDLYVGSTTNFTKRKNCHKSDCYNEGRINYGFKVYRFIRANGGWGNWSMVEIEKFTCNDSNEAHKRERFWVESLNATLNRQMPSRNRQDSGLHYRQQNKVSESIRHKNYKIANREHLREQFSCECGGHYAFENKYTHVKSQIHLAYVENPELPRIRIHEKIVCPCGGCYIFKCKERHFKTQKHLAHLENIANPPLAI